MIGRGGDQAARQDMFPTRVAEWKTQRRVASAPIGDGSSFDLPEGPIQAHLETLARLRDQHPALATGATLVRLARKQLLVVSRIDRDRRREYLVAFNSGTAAATATVTTSTPSAVWSGLYGATPTISTDTAGKATFKIPPLSSVLFRSNVDLRVRALPRPVVRVGVDPLTGTLKVATVALKTSDPASVTFAQRRAGGGWRRLASDDSPPYRAFLEPGRYRKGEHVDVVAVARGSDGRVSVSPVLSVRVR
jgi:hypothetical protein